MYQSLRTFKREMKKHLKEYRKFLQDLGKKKVKGLPYKVHQLHKEAFSVIDCGQCANCCKVMRPTYTREDIDRITAHLGITAQEYCDRYLGQDKAGDIMNIKSPC